MRRGIARLVRRYRHVLPIVGAGIVLLTFVVKDTWKDRVRDIADTVEQAERNHLIRADDEALMEVTKESMDYWYRVWSIVSLVLFAIGWTLGLVGQIYGVQTGQGGE